MQSCTASGKISEVYCTEKQKGISRLLNFTRSLPKIAEDKYKVSNTFQDFQSFSNIARIFPAVADESQKNTLRFYIVSKIYKPGQNLFISFVICNEHGCLD